MTHLMNYIKAYRLINNMKQSELAERVGVRRETIIRLEKLEYNPSLKLAMDIARVFECRVEDIFVLVEIDKNNKIIYK